MFGNRFFIIIFYEGYSGERETKNSNNVYLLTLSYGAWM